MTRPKSRDFLDTTRTSVDAPSRKPATLRTMPVTVLSVLVPLLAVAALLWFLSLWFVRRDAPLRRWFRLRRLRRLRLDRAIRHAAERDLQD